MTCVVLTRNPSNGGVLALNDDEGDIAHWHVKELAVAVAEQNTLVRAWGGWIVDLDNLEITEV